MWTIGVIAGLIAAGTIVRVLHERDNVPPMERHLRALEVLRDLAEHPTPAPSELGPRPEPSTDHVRILGAVPPGSRPARRAPARRPAARSTAAGRRKQPRPNRVSPAIERPVIEIRSEPAEPPDRPALGADPPPAPEPVPTVPAPRLTLDRFAGVRSAVVSPRVRTAALTAAAVVVVAGIVAVAGIGDRQPHRAAAAARAPASETQHPAVTSTTVRTTTTTAPPVVPVVARSTSGVTVSVPGPFELTLHANGTCWVQVTDANGVTEYMATLHSGQEQRLPVSGPIVVRLGYTPAMAISVDGVDLDLSGLSQTANLDFQSE